ncbi:MAG TPA: asparagine synthase-related protein [Steroidobacteraceae bacterium]
MFALIQGAEARVSRELLDRLARSFTHGMRRPGSWLDERGRAGAIGTVSGVLPEDINDRQPLMESGVAFVCQARLDNRNELLERLKIPRQQGAALADSEILFRCYLRWELRCLAQVYGDFAFAAWHGDCGRLVAAVDHFATIPLFYAEHNGELIVSPQLSVILANPAVTRDLNLVALGAMTAPRSLIGSTAYRAIKRIPDGYYLIREKGTVRLHRWWNPESEGGSPSPTGGDCVATASSLFKEAVSNRLRLTGGVATTLSGGLDSTLVTATAATLLAERGSELTAYTCVPHSDLPRLERKGWDSSDLDYAASVARMYPNIRHVTLSSGGLCALDLIPATHASSRTPVRNGANHLWLGRISRLANASGARVILTGQRGNVTVSSSATVDELLGARRWRSAWKYLAARRRASGQSTLQLVWASLRARVGRCERLSIEMQRPGLRFLTPQLRGQVEPLCVDECEGLSSGQRRLLKLRNFRQGWMADPWVQWGTQLRDPTADRRLVEYLLSLPAEAFLTEGHSRGLARAMGEGLVPNSVRLRRTQGAQVPEHTALFVLHRTRYETVLEAITRSTLFRSMFDVPRLRETLGWLVSGSGSLLQAHTLDRVIDVGLFVASHEGVL